MSLLSSLREKQAAKLATVTPATSATQRGVAARTVARVATVTVAESLQSNTVPPARAGSADRNTTSCWWCINFDDRPSIELVCAPAMTAEEVRRSYPEAVDVVPSTHRPETPSAPLSESERQSVLAWLRSIGERDQRLIDATLEQCNSSAEARDYFLGKAGAGSA